MKNYLSFSSSPLTRMIKAEYYDLESTLKAMRKLWKFSILQGFELQHLAEWQKDFPPRDDDPRYNRYGTWKSSIKYKVEDIAEKVNKVGVPVLSIHGNRDIGILCCSDESKDVKNAKRLIAEAAIIAERVHAKICVFHMWDTNNNNYDLSIQNELINEIAINHPKIQLSVENIPTKLKNYTPYDLVKKFKWITLDLRWVAIYNELNKFFNIKDKIVNIHVRGTLEGTELKLKGAPFTIYEAINLIKNDWNYKGLFTIEPEGGLNKASWEDLVKAISSINNLITNSVIE